MEDKKVNINVGYDKLTKEDISSHKNFGKVYQNYISNTGVKPMKVAKKFPFSKLMLVTTVVVTVTTVSIWKYKSSTSPSIKASAAQVNHSANSTSVVKSHDTLKRPFINPPIKGINVPYKTYNVDASKGGALAYNNSKIVIPAGSFCDEKGNEIKGNVQINYREFHDAIDFFVCGIPMTYDSAGKQYNFESAGMLDIKGTQNGKPVFIKPGKNLQVEMASHQTGTKYNVYMLDTVRKSWTYIDKSNYTVKEVKTTVTKQQTYQALDSAPRRDSLPEQRKLAVLKKEEKKLEAEKPVAPAKADEKSYTFNIDADSKDFPELSVYQNVEFEVDQSNKDYNPEWVKTVWNDAKLARNENNKDLYVFTVSNGDVKHSIIVRPVFKGKNYEEAMKEYNQKFTEYKAKYDAKKEEEQRQIEAYKKMLAEMAKKQAEENARQQALIEKEQKRANTVAEVTNFLRVASFGIFNCDNPDNLPEGAKLTPYYTDMQKDDLNNNSVFLVRKDRNSIINYYPGHDCSFNPLERNFAWAVTPDHKIAIYSEEDFNKIKQTRGKFTFIFTVLDKEINDYADVKEALKPYMM